jgi:hypothetical protein
LSSSALKIKKARLVDNASQPGLIVIAYELVNTSETDLQVPIDSVYSQYIDGIRQHWIERKGDDNTLPASGQRQGRRYAAGGTIIPCNKTIHAGHSFTFQQRLSTKGFPEGKYAYYIEHKAPVIGTLETIEVEFELNGAP